MLSFPHIDPVALQIGPLAIRWYALAYLAGIGLAWAYINRMIRTKKVWRGTAPVAQPEDVGDFVTWATLGIILGGRLGYVGFYNASYYVAHPLEIAQVWQGGMSFHGGMIGVVIAVILFTRKRGIALAGFSDLVACGVPIGLFFGRVANFINGELWGRVTDGPLGMMFPGGGPVPRHPSQLYEAALEGVVLFAALYLISHYTRALSRPWLMTGLFVAGYGFARTLAEFFREPDAHIGFLAGGLTMGMILSVPMLVAGVLIAGFALRREPAS